jgi:sulfur carrier protein
MNVTVNGKPETMDAQAPLAELLPKFTGSETTDGIAVAINDEVVRRNDWPCTWVVDGDRIEIVKAAQGG